MMDAVTLLGLTAASCTTMAFIPQVVKIWRTRSTADISLGTFSLFTLGIALWLVYGLIITDVPLIVSNVVTIGLAGTILTFKLKYG